MAELMANVGKWIDSIDSQLKFITESFSDVERAGNDEVNVMDLINTTSDLQSELKAFGHNISATERALEIANTISIELHLLEKYLHVLDGFLEDSA